LGSTQSFGDRREGDAQFRGDVFQGRSPGDVEIAQSVCDAECLALTVGQSITRGFGLPISREAMQLEASITPPERREPIDHVPVGEPAGLSPPIRQHFDPLDDRVGRRQGFEAPERPPVVTACSTSVY